jgi:hypothetical protein
MTPDQEIESLLKSLQPAELPPELRRRMQQAPDARAEKVLHFPIHRRLVIALTAAAACGAAWLSLRGPDPVERPAVEAPAVSVRQTQSTLVATRPISLVEHDGRVWELAEQEWLDEDIALCSTSPVRVRLAETRREVVYRPVAFD